MRHRKVSRPRAKSISNAVRLQIKIPTVDQCVAFRRWALALPLAWMVSASVRAEDWPQWRGPQRTGVSTEKAWLDQWPADGPKTAWKAKVGLGFSSFVAAQGRVLTMGHAEEQDTVWCFDAAIRQGNLETIVPGGVGGQILRGRHHRDRKSVV